MTILPLRTRCFYIFVCIVFAGIICYIVEQPSRKAACTTIKGMAERVSFNKRRSVHQGWLEFPFQDFGQNATASRQIEIDTQVADVSGVHQYLNARSKEIRWLSFKGSVFRVEWAESIRVCSRVLCLSITARRIEGCFPAQMLGGHKLHVVEVHAGHVSDSLFEAISNAEDIAMCVINISYVDRHILEKLLAGNNIHAIRFELLVLDQDCITALLNASTLRAISVREDSVDIVDRTRIERERPDITLSVHKY